MPDLAVIEHIAGQVAEMKRSGTHVILVSSGAVGAGRSLMPGLDDLSRVVRRQVLASLGQVKLMQIYDSFFGPKGFFCAQVLATKEDFRDRQHYINMKSCFLALQRDNIVPIVNENDVIAIDELMFTDNDELAGLVAAMTGADAVVNCVGTFDKSGKNNFEAVQAEGAARIARIAAETGVASLVHISAIGASADAASRYSRTKAEGEAGVLRHFPGATILRPSVMFGPEDGFFNRFASMARFGPVLSIVGGNTRFQPVYVDDVAQAAVAGIEGRASGTYELGGPDVASFRDWIRQMLTVILRRRLIVNLPFWVASIMGNLLDFGSALTGRLFPNKILTADQVKTLKVDNVVAEGAKTLSDLGIAPTPAGAVLPDYLWRFRPSGQYDAIKASAKNLRQHG